MIVSNSGVNHAPVEAALIAKRKIKTIALTSYKFSNKHPLKVKKRLYEICDIYIDNKIPPGDAVVEINKMMVGPASSITGAFILNSILLKLLIY